MHFGLIGIGLDHSRSPELFEELFIENGKNGTYSLFELANISELPKMLKENSQLGGFTVTMPFKRDIFPFLTHISDEAKSIGAVNAVKIIRGSTDELLGYNTDVIGFDKMLNGYQKLNKRALILGTGGASDSVRFVLNKYKIPFTLVSRKEGNADMTYKSLKKLNLNEFDWIINATPIGMHPNENQSPDIDYEQILPKHICIDLIYNPNETLFMLNCKAKGAATQNGFLMLKEQAKAAFEIFTSPL